MKCFYHSADLDGHCSGAIVKNSFHECDLIGINYGDAFPWESIKAKETVFMVDFSLQPFDQMIELWSRCDLIWIDHHISAIKECESHTDPMNISGVRKDGIGACQLVWKYLNPGDPVPEFIKLLAEYDVWDHSNPRTLPFQYGMRLMKTWPGDPESIIWEQLFNPLYSKDVVNSIVDRGETVIDYVYQDNEKYCSSCAFDTHLDGLRCIAVNKMLTNSQVFTSVWDNSRYDAMLTFGWRKGKWTVSLYTDKDDIDVSIIAKGRGGGGHKQAAGFQCSELPFELK